MMSDKTKNIYSEVYSFLNIISEEERNKIPNKLIKMIEEERNREYTPSYSFDIPIEEQTISDEAIAMIALLHLNYWCKDDEERKELNKFFDENETNYQKELREKYNPDNIFKNRKASEEQPVNKEESVAMIEYKESLFTKIKEWFRNLFNRKRYN